MSTEESVFEHANVHKQQAHENFTKLHENSMKWTFIEILRDEPLLGALNNDFIEK